MNALVKEHEAKMESWGLPALEQRRERTRKHLAQIAGRRETWINRNNYYYDLVSRLLRFLVEPQKKVLSIRCDTGVLLAVVSPRKAKGIDICTEIIQIAQERNPTFDFAVGFSDTEQFLQLFGEDENFDYILFNDIGDTVDVLQAFQNLKPLCRRAYNECWSPHITVYGNR